MLAATRNGQHFLQGDEGFEEAWQASMLDAINAAVKDAEFWHQRRMAIDPEYRIKQEAFAAEYERLFCLI